MTAHEKLTKKYELEASLSELEFRKEELEEVIPLLKHQKREADVAALATEGLLQRILDRFSGRREEDRENAARAARAAAAALEGAQRDLAIVQGKLETIRAEREALGEKTALLEEVTEQEQAYFRRLEASLCAEAALHFLRKARKELAAAQELSRNPMMAVGDGNRENIHKANAGDYADKCREKLAIIQACGIDFEIHPYLQNPMGYLVTAMRYGDMDRMNSAQKGIRDTEAALKELLLQLAE